MVRANLGFGNSITHGDPGTHYLASLEATFGLGASNFYGVAGYRGQWFDNPGQGTGSENTFLIGVTMAFGGDGTLRSAMDSTPMIASELSSLVAVGSSIVD